MVALAACGGAGPAAGGANVAPAGPPNAPQSRAITAAEVVPPSTGPAARTQEAPPAESTPPEPPLALPDLAESPGAVELEAGAQALRKKDIFQAQKRLGAALVKLDPEKDPAAVLVGRALFGRSWGSSPWAAREYQKVPDLWSDPTTAQRLTGEGGDKAKRGEQHGRALLAAAEAMFFFAEQKRLEANKKEFPIYRGKNTREGVSKFVATEVADYVKAKQSVISELDKAYRRIIDLKPEPPAWVVASWARTAMMRGKLVAEHRAAPIPEAWKRTGKIFGSDMTAEEIRAFYYASLDKASEPLKAQAKTAFEACKRQADRFKHSDENERICRLWLEKYGFLPHPEEPAQ